MSSLYANLGKKEEVIKLSNDELKEQLIENKKKFNELKMAHAVSPLENPIHVVNE